VVSDAISVENSFQKELWLTCYFQS